MDGDAARPGWSPHASPHGAPDPVPPYAPQLPCRRAGEGGLREGGRRLSAARRGTPRAFPSSCTFYIILYPPSPPGTHPNTRPAADRASSASLERICSRSGEGSKAPACAAGGERRCAGRGGGPRGSEDSSLSWPPPSSSSSSPISASRASELRNSRAISSVRSGTRTGDATGVYGKGKGGRRGTWACPPRGCPWPRTRPRAAA